MLNVYSIFTCIYHKNQPNVGKVGHTLSIWKCLWGASLIFFGSTKIPKVFQDLCRNVGKDIGFFEKPPGIFWGGWWMDVRPIQISYSTWRIIPVSKELVTTIYKPFRPFGRGTTLLRGLTNHGYYLTTY